MLNTGAKTVVSKLPFLSLILSLLWITACSKSNDPKLFDALRSDVDLAIRCHKPTVHKVPVSRTHFDGESLDFNFVYEHYQDAGPTAPTLIVIPGGPGQTLIGLPRSRFPSNVNLILIDPRGTGCHQLEYNKAFSNDELSSYAVAMDIVSLITQLKLTNYYIYGVSYGTVVATILASEFDRYPVQEPPKKIILEGIVNKSFRNKGGDGFHKEWFKIRKQISPTVLQGLENGNYLGIPDGDWGLYISDLLSQGALPRRPHFVRDSLSNFAKFKQEMARKRQIEDLYRKVNRSPRRKSSYFDDKFYTVVGCKEIYDPNQRYGFERGEFIIYNNPVCQKFSHQPYDSARWQAKVPMLYFQGENDPNTPMQGALQHFQRQRGSENQLVIVKGAGHNPLFYNFSFALGCKEIIWRKIVSNEKLTSNDFKFCSMPITLSP